MDIHCFKCKQKKQSSSFTASKGYLRKHKICVDCRIKKKNLISTEIRKKRGQQSSKRYYKNRKRILARKKYIREEERSWRQLFGDDPFDLYDKKYPYF